MGERRSRHVDDDLALRFAAGDCSTRLSIGSPPESETSRNIAILYSCRSSRPRQKRVAVGNSLGGGGTRLTSMMIRTLAMCMLLLLGATSARDAAASSLESDVLAEVNFARTHPRNYADELRRYR